MLHNSGTLQILHDPYFGVCCIKMLESLTAGDLTIELADEPEVIRCVWRGRSNERRPSDLLVPYFERLLIAAQERGLPLHMHFEELDHFNSSTITSLIRLIQRARRHGVRLAMIYDQNVKWQRLSFNALRVFDRSDGMLEFRSI